MDRRATGFAGSRPGFVPTSPRFGPNAFRFALKAPGTARIALGLVAAWWLTGVAPLAAQQVRGTVLDPALESPVADALVIMVNEDGERVATVLTTPEGRFFLDVPRAGAYQVGVARLGYQQAITPRFEVTDADVAMDILLPADPVDLEELRVESNRNTPDAGRLRGFLPDERNAGTLIGRLSRVEIESAGPQTDMVGLLAHMNVPGLRARRVALSTGGSATGICVENGRNRSVLGKTASAALSGSFSAPRDDPTGTSLSNECQMAAVYIDGLFVADAADVLAGLTGSDIEQMQAVSPLEALARFGARAANGALLIWTRNGR